MICVNGKTNELKLGDVLEIKLDKYFQPTKIFGILWDEKIYGITFEFKKDFIWANSLQSTKQKVLKTLNNLQIQWEEALPTEIKKDWKNALGALLHIVIILYFL